MTDNTKKTIKYSVIFAILVAGGYFAYTKLVPSSSASNTTVSKEDMVASILSNSGGTGDYNFIMSLDPAFVSDWYNAVKNNKPTFKSGTGTFNTVSGTAV